MSRRWVWLVAVSLCTTAPAAWADTPGSLVAFASAGDLRTWCLGRGTVRASCVGYLAGVVDLLREPAPGEVAGSGPKGVACPPRGLSSEQLRVLFRNHMHANPRRAGRGAAGVVRESLEHVFPCARDVPPAEHGTHPPRRPPNTPGGRVS